MLRRRYDNFLGDIYYPDSILARTTDFDRTKMTALLVLAGLYPPSPIQQWNDDLDWMPIPYHFERGEHDYVSFIVRVFMVVNTVVLVYQTSDGVLSELFEGVGKGVGFE